MGVSRLLDSAFNSASSAIGRLKRERAAVDPWSLSVPINSPVRDLLARTRAADMVWLAAILERFIKESLTALTMEIHRTGTRSCDLRPSILTVCSDFDRLRDLRDHEKVWDSKIDVMGRPLSTSSFDLSNPNQPLDGRTIREGHLRVIWKVFGLAGNHLADVRIKIPLNDVADARNDVAHGAVDSVDFGRSRTDADVLRSVDAIDTTVCYTHLAMDDYLKRKLYRR